MRIIYTIATAICLLFPAIIQAQETPAGTIKGKLIDKSTKQTIPGGTIAVKGTANGAVTDADGVFTIANIAEGVYQLVASSIGYQEKTINDVSVIRNKTNYIEMELEAPPVALKEVAITSFKYEASPLHQYLPMAFRAKRSHVIPVRRATFLELLVCSPAYPAAAGNILQ